MIKAYSLFVLGGLALVACGGDDPVSYSAPVGINLKAKSDDVTNGVVTDDKGINTESGNPYGAFVTDARAEIGADPGLIDVAGVDLFIGANSTGVTKLGEVFAGQVDVLFEMNDTNNSYTVASGAISADSGAGPIGADVTFAADEVPDLDYAKLLAGSFKVVVRGPAAPGFATAGADVDLQVTLTFAAFE